MGSYLSFEDLPVWQEARRLSLEIYQCTYAELFAKDFALTSQIRRSAGSVMDNIAEGFERDSRLEFINFLSISKGSTGEVRSLLHRAFDLQYINLTIHDSLTNAYKRLLSHIANFTKYLNQSDNKGNKFKDRV